MPSAAITTVLPANTITTTATRPTSITRQCPYNFDDRTGADSRPSGGSSGSVEMPVLRNDSDTAEPVKASTSTWDDLVSLITSTKFWLGIAETVIAFAIPVAIYEWAMRSRKKKK